VERRYEAPAGTQSKADCPVKLSMSNSSHIHNSLSNKNTELRVIISKIFMPSKRRSSSSSRRPHYPPCSAMMGLGTGHKRVRHLLEHFKLKHGNLDPFS
jgi:hypothetical protein